MLSFTRKISSHSTLSPLSSLSIIRRYESKRFYSVQVSGKAPSAQFVFLDPPSVRVFLETYGIDRSQISTASGKNGRITKADIIQFQSTDAFKKLSKRSSQLHSTSISTSISGGATNAKQTNGAPTSSRPRPLKYQDINASLTRKIIASRLLESKQQLPHFYMSTEAQIDKLIAYREHLKSNGIKVSLNDIIIKLAGRALEIVPQCNSVFNPKTGQHEVQEAIDISIAVATDGGLITPIIKSANRKTIEKISNDVKELATRARSGGLKPEEFQGGSFCISNLGMYGIKNFEAVINPPQALILAVGGSEKRTYIESNNTSNDKFGFNASLDLNELDEVDPDKLNNGNGELKTATFLTVTVSADARAVDGKDVGDFLAALKDLLEMRISI